MSRKSLARQASNGRALAYTPAPQPNRANSAESHHERINRKRAEMIAILGHDPSETPNYYETLPPREPTQRDVRHLAVELVIQRDGTQCYLCKKHLTPRLACLEHIIPLTYGGENTAANIALACYGCNSRKADRYVSFSVPSGSPCYHQPRT